MNSNWGTHAGSYIPLIILKTSMFPVAAVRLLLVAVLGTTGDESVGSYGIFINLPWRKLNYHYNNLIYIMISSFENIYDNIMIYIIDIITDTSVWTVYLRRCDGEWAVWWRHRVTWPWRPDAIVTGSSCTASSAISISIEHWKTVDTRRRPQCYTCQTAT